MTDNEADTITQLMRQIEVLRDALQGRTVSCSLCNYTTQRHDELIEAVQVFVRLSKGTHGRQWFEAMDNMCRLANVKP